MQYEQQMHLQHLGVRQRPYKSSLFSAVANFEFHGRGSYILQLFATRAKMGVCSSSPIDLAIITPCLHISVGLDKENMHLMVCPDTSIGALSVTAV